MLLTELVLAGFAASLLLSLLLARSLRATALLAAAGVAAWLSASIYLVRFASCGSGEGECEPALGAFLLLFSLAGWLAGTLCGQLLRARVLEPRS